MMFKIANPKSVRLRHALLLGSFLTSPLWFATPQVLAVTLSGYQNITGITTKTTSGTANSVTGNGGGGSYSSTTNYTLNFAGTTTAITGFSTDLGVGTVNTALSTTFNIRRNPTTNNSQIVWYQGSQSGNTFNLQAGGPLTEDAALAANNILVGSDNLFVNTGNGANNNTANERLDYVVGSGIAVGNTKGFTIFERGDTTAHDGFKIAAITGVDSSGNPNNYGTLYTVASGWGTAALNGTNNYYILNNSSASGAGAPQNPSSSANQSIGGVFISTDLLASAGTTIYGYSLFSSDTPDSCIGNSLVDYTNRTCFPSTPDSGAATAGAGIDLVAANLGAVSYRRNAVPFELSPGLGILAIGAWGVGIKLERKLRSRGMAIRAKRTVDV